MFATSQSNPLQFSINSGGSIDKVTNNASLNYQWARGFFVGFAFSKPILTNRMYSEIEIESIYNNRNSYIKSKHLNEQGIIIRDGDIYSVFHYLALNTSYRLFLFKKRTVFFQGGLCTSYLVKSYLSNRPVYKFYDLGDGTQIGNYSPIQPENWKNLDFGYLIGVGLNSKLDEGIYFRIKYLIIGGLIDINDDLLFANEEFKSLGQRLSFSLIFALRKK